MGTLRNSHWHYQRPKPKVSNWRKLYDLEFLSSLIKPRNPGQRRKLFQVNPELRRGQILKPCHEHFQHLYVCVCVCVFVTNVYNKAFLDWVLIKFFFKKRQMRMVIQIIFFIAMIKYLKNFFVRKNAKYCR